MLYSSRTVTPATEEEKGNRQTPGLGDELFCETGVKVLAIYLSLEPSPVDAIDAPEYHRAP